MRRQAVLLLSLVLVLHILTPGTAAAEVPDLQAGGSITVTVRTGAEAVDSGSLTIYHAAEIAEDNGTYQYVLTEDFRPSGLSLEHPNDPDLAACLERYAVQNKIPGETRSIENGTVRFEVPEGKLGLYLVVQNQACAGYEPLSPFVIGVPACEDGSYRYDVDATPKTEELNPKPTQPEAPTVPTGPTQPPEPDLPQAGQPNWPVPVLAAAGLILFAVGWRLSRRKGTHEA